MKLGRILIIATLFLIVGVQNGCGSEVDESEVDEVEKAYRENKADEALAKGLPCARKGNDRCQFIVGEIYLIYKKNKREEAIKWYEKSASQGYAIAQDKLARVILNDNPKRGFQLFQQAANQGNLRSKHFLGKLYISGKAGIKDPKKGFQLIRGVALTGDDWAQYDLGTLYRQGLGTRQDLVEAYKWYLIALRGSTGVDDSIGQGAEDAIMFLREKLSSEQIQEAETRANKFSKKNQVP